MKYFLLNNIFSEKISKIKNNSLKNQVLVYIFNIFATYKYGSMIKIK